jgi:hypothetical protein
MATDGGPWIDRSGMIPMQTFNGESMPTEIGSRKRIPLGKYPTYEAANAAKKLEQRYHPDQLQIRKRKYGTEFQLVARVSIKPTNKVETE